VSVPEISSEKPVIVPGVGAVVIDAVHLYVTIAVPVTSGLNAIELFSPLQIVRLVGVAINFGTGFTVISTLKGAPSQVLDPFGITVYVIVTGTFVVLV
jgi:hypothetical protein